MIKLTVLSEDRARLIRSRADTDSSRSEKVPA